MLLCRSHTSAASTRPHSSSAPKTSTRPSRLHTGSYKHVLGMIRAAAATEQQPTAEGGALPWYEKDSAPNMINIHGVQNLVDEMAKAGDRLVILDFYAPWCNACRSLYPKFVKLMQKHVDDTVFLKINWEENRDIARMMDIKVLPYFQFYQGAEGKVDQFSCTVSRITRFKDALDQYSGSFCSLDESPGLVEFPDVKPTGSREEEQFPTGPEDPEQPTDAKAMVE